MLALPQALTQLEASACLAMLLEGLHVEATPEVMLDASALSRFDSSALAVLLEFRRHGLALGKNVKVCGLSARLSDLAQLYGVDELLAADAAASASAPLDATAVVAPRVG